jgi:hypothetical protein
MQNISTQKIFLSSDNLDVSRILLEREREIYNLAILFLIYKNKSEQRSALIRQ